jgi:hypothetical protein
VWFGEPDADTTDKPPAFKAKLKTEDRGKAVELIETAITDANAVRQWAVRAKRELERLQKSVGKSPVTDSIWSGADAMG